MKVTLIIITCIIIVAVLLGVPIPWAVFELFLYIIAVVAVFSWIASWGKKR